MSRTTSIALLLASSVADAQAPLPQLDPGPTPSTIWWGDFDGDGLDDAYVLGEGGAGRLLVNLGDGSFEDITIRAGLDRWRRVEMALWGDFDGDGRADLFLVSFDTGSRLLRQTAQGTFEDATAEAGIPQDLRLVDAHWLDYDRDGAPDLHAVGVEENVLYHNFAGGLFERITLGEQVLVSAAMFPASFDEARRLRGLPPVGGAGGSGGSTNLSGTIVVSQAPGSLPAPNLVVCADTVVDQASPGTCMSASSIPTLGMLFPISNELFVSAANGRVGIGTTVPIAPLAVEGHIFTSGGIVFPDFTIQMTAQVQGPAGATGPQGPTGNDGADGAQGPAGPAGATGAPGATGNDGADGAQGPAGNDGADGAQGPAGPAGATGAPGATGNDGADGAQGPAGNDGADGAQGPAGPAGATGAPGATGNDGADGAQGPAGNDGAVGAQGPAGPAGATGAPGATGNDGADGAQGPAGNDGADGAQGPAGPAGATGAPGATGNDGADGAQGPAGNDGADGAQGPAGPAGAMGAPGATGNDGADGVQGPAGPAGPAGPTGPGGPTGPQGPTGLLVGGAANETARHDGVDWIASSLLQNDGTRVSIGTTPSPFALLSVSADPAGADSGVQGESWGSANGGAGVRGVNFSGNGRGVFGQALGLSAAAAGVEGESVFGEGVRGFGTIGVSGVGTETSPAAGQTVIGVLGSSGYDEGVGVKGSATGASAFGVFSEGDFGGTGAKFFIQPHPTDFTKEVRFICLEGNESGTYFRGSGRLADGRAVIEVPAEFRLVSELTGLTVQLTGIGSPAPLWIESKGLDEIVVRGAEDIEFDYFVNGVRRGFADIQLIHPNRSFVPTVRGVPFGVQYPAALRRVLVENGLLNADFTPNEAAAAAMGWTLVDPEVGVAELEARRAARASILLRQAELEAGADAR